MTGTQIVEFFNNLIDDTPDSVYTYDLMNGCKDAIEGERDWEFLKKFDATKSWATSDTYATEHDLPTDFVEPVSLYVGTEYQPYTPVPFEQKYFYKDTPKRYFIDHQAGHLHMCGSTSESKTLYLCYIYQTNDLDSSTSPVWKTRFHRLLPYYMAGIHLGAVDADDIARVLSPENKVQYLLLRKNMISWDARLKGQAMNHQAWSGFGNNVEAIPDVVY